MGASESPLSLYVDNHLPNQYIGIYFLFSYHLMDLVDSCFWGDVIEAGVGADPLAIRCMVLQSPNGSIYIAFIQTNFQSLNYDRLYCRKVIISYKRKLM